jgi:predicted regulator of Ras-like GTPase activity (Roadblock/LC7/MglB family)
MLGFIKSIFVRRVPAAAPAKAQAHVPAKPAVATTPTIASAQPKDDRGDGETISVPIEAIAAGLPDTHMSAVASKRGEIRFGLSFVQSQLASGEVRIRFGELVRLAPPGTISSLPGLDDVQVALPLGAILAALPREAWRRAPTGKKIELPDDVADIFGPRGQSAGQGRAAPPLETAAIPPAATPELDRIEPKLEVPSIRVDAKLTIEPVQPAPVEPIRMVESAQAPVVGSSASFEKNDSGATPTLSISEPEVSTDFLAVALSQILAEWPETILQEIDANQWANRMVRLPLARLEAGLKTAQIRFAWGELIATIRPSPSPASLASPHEMTVLDLPLPVIAPLFFAKHRPAPPPRRHVSLEGIPDLFAPPKPSAAPAIKTDPATAPPARRGPKEIVEEATKIAGVTQAILISEDGLPVAAHLSLGLSQENVAAFLPAIYGKIERLGGDLRLGELRDARLNFGGCQWIVAKAGKAYFAAAGAPDQPIPESAIKGVIAELAPLFA